MKRANGSMALMVIAAIFFSGCATKVKSEYTDPGQQPTDFSLFKLVNVEVHSDERTVFKTEYSKPDVLRSALEQASEGKIGPHESAPLNLSVSLKFTPNKDLGGDWSYMLTYGVLGGLSTVLVPLVFVPSPVKVNYHIDYSVTDPKTNRWVGMTVDNEDSVKWSRHILKRRFEETVSGKIYGWGPFWSLAFHRYTEKDADEFVLKNTANIIVKDLYSYSDKLSTFIGQE